MLAKSTLIAQSDGANHTENAYAIQTDRLAKTYRGVAALKSLNLRVPPYSICGFLGPNGSGKSTAFRLLLGLARPTSGSGNILGYDIARDNLAIRKHIGYLPQDQHFYEYMTARETLRFVAHFFYTGPQAALERRIAEMLELVGLSEKADRSVKGFSGGERQRLGIAQAQINEPKLLLLDEPAAALDPLGRKAVLDIMQRLRGKTTILYSTHLLDDVQRVSDMVVILKDGEQIAQAPIETLLATYGNSQVIYELTLRGDVRAALARVSSQPWIEHVEVSNNGQDTNWRVIVKDEQIAQAQLLALVAADAGVAVIHFGRQKQELENAFMNVIEGNIHGA